MCFMCLMQILAKGAIMAYFLYYPHTWKPAFTHRITEKQSLAHVLLVFVYYSEQLLWQE